MRSLPFFPLPLPLDRLEARGGEWDLDLARDAFLWVTEGWSEEPEPFSGRR